MKISLKLKDHRGCKTLKQSYSFNLRDYEPLNSLFIVTSHWKPPETIRSLISG